MLNLLTTAVNYCPYDPTHTVMGARGLLRCLCTYVLCVRAFLYSGTSPIRTPLGRNKVARCPDFRGCSVDKQGYWNSEMCPVYCGALIPGCSD